MDRRMTMQQCNTGCATGDVQYLFMRRNVKTKKQISKSKKGLYK